MFVLKKRNLIIISVLILTALTFILCFGALGIKTIDDTDSKKIKVVLDAGHGGVDGGVLGVNTGVKESELNLIIAKKVENYLVSAGIQVVLTRNSDAGLYGTAIGNLKRKDMKRRKEIIEKAKPDLVVSIHMNKFSTSTRRGAQVFYKEGDELGETLAKSIQNEFNQMEQASRSCSALTGDYYILNCTNYPSVIAECGFLSNPEDEALLITEEYQDALSYTIYCGIVGYLSQMSFNYF